MISKKAAAKRDIFLAKMHALLTAEKSKLVLESAAQLRSGRDLSRDDCMDSCDLAAEEHQREMSMMLSERERLKVGQIDEALRRIALHNYGLCEMCGLEVGAERLIAMPFTRLCCDCQQDREREAKTRRPHEEPAHQDHELRSAREQEEGGAV
jgi:DnaK suppressor protein